MKIININIFIAIFLYGGERLKLTELIFKHYINIKKKFKNIANFKFTILGSEKDLSKNLTLKYFSENEYFEFDQNNPKYNRVKKKKKLYTMLSDKINTGIKLASRYNDDIIFWAGSNDYVSQDFFEQIIEYYNPNNRQIYGITSFINGNNANFYSKYDEKKNDFNIHDKVSFWFNGIHPGNRKKFKYVGCIIGLNSKLLNENKDILEIWNCDEGYVEEYILNLENIDFFSSKNIFSWNIKTTTNNEVTSFDTLKTQYLNSSSIISFDDIQYKNKINDEIKYFIEMSKNI